MDSRTAKLALARQKLKTHQEKKSVFVLKETAEPRHEDLLQNQNVTEIVNYDTQELLDMRREENNVEDMQQNINNVNVTEILILNKQDLELKVKELQTELLELKSTQMITLQKNESFKQQIDQLQSEFNNLNYKYATVVEDIKSKDVLIKQLETMRIAMTDENNNLREQMEFTKNILNSKESDNNALKIQLSKLQSQLDTSQLQLQQLMNGSSISITDSKSNDKDRIEEMLQKIANLEHQNKTLLKEREQNNIHYEQYVNELNNQMKILIARNEDLTKELNILSQRENSLIEQISEMEIRLQNYNPKNTFMNNNDIDVEKLQENYSNVLKNMQALKTEYDELETKYKDSELRVLELNEMKSSCTCDHESISVSKLNADITSDKIAAQRATEQNRKLKTDIQELEDAFVKMSRDKLDLTEKVTAEKYLNRELTIKLAEVEEKAKDVQIKLMAKDEEMIRLQVHCRELETLCEKFSERKTLTEDAELKEDNDTNDDTECSKTPIDKTDKLEYIHTFLEDRNNLRIPKEDAMLKLQQRFLKIMDEVADLSDEKHRLEHIILQLQNETDTICEYVALYQQQRSLLKQRDAERSAQIKVFQSECERLKNQLEELSDILVRFSEDKELSTYFQDQSRNKEMTKVIKLLSDIKTNSLVDPNKNCAEWKDFYPCNCCSGQLIDI